MVYLISPAPDLQFYLETTLNCSLVHDHYADSQKLYMQDQNSLLRT
jgi:hypothetical protein